MSESLSTRDGRPVLRIERRLAHPPEKVWRAITDPEQLSQWYPFRAVEMDLRVDGRITFDVGDGTTMEAVVVEFDPPRVFAFSEHAPEQMTRESDDLVQFELRPEDAGCLLIFTHVFDDRPAAASYGAGWTICLDGLRLLLDGKSPESSLNNVELHEHFVAEFGLDAGRSEATSDGWRVRFERQFMGTDVDSLWTTLTEEKGPAEGSAPPARFTTREFPAGEVTEIRAPDVLEYEWSGGGHSIGRIRWELSQGPGGARVGLTQTGPDHLAGERTAALDVWRGRLTELAAKLMHR